MTWRACPIRTQRRGREGGTSEHAERRGESEEERLDRNLMELLQELRVAIPGIQFLFAFLLVVPFQQGWAQVSDFETTVYYVTLLLTDVLIALHDRADGPPSDALP